MAQENPSYGEIWMFSKIYSSLVSGAVGTIPCFIPTWRWWCSGALICPSPSPLGLRVQCALSHLLPWYDIERHRKMMSEEKRKKKALLGAFSKALRWNRWIWSLIKFYYTVTDSKQTTKPQIFQQKYISWMEFSLKSIIQFITQLTLRLYRDRQK